MTAPTAPDAAVTPNIVAPRGARALIGQDDAARRCDHRQVAIGTGPASVLAMVVRQSLRLAPGGIVVGLALVLPRFLESQLGVADRSGDGCCTPSDVCRSHEKNWLSAAAPLLGRACKKNAEHAEPGASRRTQKAAETARHSLLLTPSL